MSDEIEVLAFCKKCFDCELYRDYLRGKIPYPCENCKIQKKILALWNKIPRAIEVLKLYEEINYEFARRIASRSRKN